MGRDPLSGFPVYVRRIRNTSPQTSNEPFIYEEVDSSELNKLDENECDCPLCKAGIPLKTKKILPNNLTEH